MPLSGSRVLVVKTVAIGKTFAGPVVPEASKIMPLECETKVIGTREIRGYEDIQ